MPKTQTRNPKKFVLNKVYPYSSVSSLWFALPILFVYAMAYYYWFGDGFRLGLISLIFMMYFATVVGIVRLLSKNVTIWFDDQYMYLQSDQKEPQKFTKQEILGFYSYDYLTPTPLLFNSKISIQFYLCNGKKLFLNDSNYRSRIDEDKRRLLFTFLKTVQSELEFYPVRRKYKYYANNVYWYSRHHNKD